MHRDGQRFKTMLELLLYPIFKRVSGYEPITSLQDGASRQREICVHQFAQVLLMTE